MDTNSLPIEVPAAKPSKENSPVESPVPQENTKKTKRNYWKFISFLLVIIVSFLIGLVFYFWQETNRLSQTATETVLETPSPSPTIDIDNDLPGFTTYKNLRYEYELKYPNNWTVEEKTGSPVDSVDKYQYLQFQSPDKNFILNFGLKYKNETGIIISGRTGTPAGEFEDGGTLALDGVTLNIQKLVYEGKTNTVFFQSGDQEPKYEILGDFAYVGSDLNYMYTTDIVTADEYKTAYEILTSFKFTGSDTETFP